MTWKKIVVANFEKEAIGELAEAALGLAAGAGAAGLVSLVALPVAEWARRKDEEAAARAKPKDGQPVPPSAADSNSGAGTPQVPSLLKPKLTV